MASKTIGTYLNRTHDRSVVATAFVGGAWDIRGGAHLFAPLYAHGEEVATDRGVRAAVHALEARHIAEYRAGDDVTAIRWGIDRLALFDDEEAEAEALGPSDWGGYDQMMADKEDGA